MQLLPVLEAMLRMGVRNEDAREEVRIPQGRVDHHEKERITTLVDDIRDNVRILLQCEDPTRT